MGILFPFTLCVLTPTPVCHLWTEIHCSSSSYYPYSIPVFDILSTLISLIYLSSILFTLVHSWLFKCPFVLVMGSSRVSGSLAFVEIDLLRDHWISYSLCSTMMGMNLVPPVTFNFPLITGSCIIGIVRLYKVSNFLNEFNKLSYCWCSWLV